jgi:Lar family restriction alleviation protein
MTKTLRPCPFCGGEPDPIPGEFGDNAFVECTVCRSVGPDARTTHEAVQVWNTRRVWQPIDTAPKDRPILVYAPGREGLPALFAECQWHPDAGFCVDKIREPTLWTELPESEG